MVQSNIQKRKWDTRLNRQAVTSDPDPWNRAMETLHIWLESRDPHGALLYSTNSRNAEAPWEAHSTLQGARTGERRST